MDTREIKSTVHYITRRPQDDHKYLSYRFTWHGAGYKTNIIFGARVHAPYIFRDPRYKLAAHTHHTYTCRYCDCNGYVYSMRKNLKTPKLRQHCKHVDTAMDDVLERMRAFPLGQPDRITLDDYNNALRTAHDKYMEAIDRQEEYPHKTTYAEYAMQMRTTYHRLQIKVMTHLSREPHLYAHSIHCTLNNYPHIQMIK